jgi:Holliday junction resolvasome RuvABC ATP-dependent DNA helicase subunit
MKPYYSNYPYDTKKYNMPIVYYGGKPIVDPRAYGKYVDSVYTKPLEKKQKKIVNLELDIQTLDHLIDLAKKVGGEYELSAEIEYNIDLKMLKNLLPEMETLNAMIGQKTLKNQVANLILYFCLHLNLENDDLMHTIIDGGPGTGKTEFAKKIAKIYLKLGVLKRDIFKKVRRSDLIAGYLGQTALKTEEVIQEARGGVLFIDEAYSLGNNDGKDSRDSFSKECVDILNQSLTEMRDNPNDYFILIIAGYKEDLQRSFFSLNDGLERRFTIHFTMDEYDSAELVEIFKKKTTESGWNIADFALTKEFVEKNKPYFKYAGGDMETWFVKCKIAHSRNLISGKNKNKLVLNAIDIQDGLDIFIKNPMVGNRVPDDDRHAAWRSIYN